MGKAQVQDNAEERDGFVDELKPGTKLMHGQYTIESFLNAGGFGITYLAKDSLDRKIVIKECFPGAFCRRSRYIVQARSRAHQNELRSIVRLFVQEARSLAKLDHPNIVGVHQVFEDNDTAYMALDFVEGRDLLDTIEDQNSKLEPDQVKKLLVELLDAVGFIHSQDILHRDISPDNILLNADFRPILIDFGAAREEATKQSRVLSAMRVVKDGYSPQEFYIAGSEQTPSSDLYALGASFYHLLAGEIPPNSQARLAAIASSEPDPYVPLTSMSSIDGYTQGFLAAIDKALAILPKDRVQSAQDWLDMVNDVDARSAVVTALKVVGSGAPDEIKEAGQKIDSAATKQAISATMTGAVEDVDASGEVASVAVEPKKSKTGLLLASVAVIALVGVGTVVMMPSGDAPAPVIGDSATVAETASAPIIAGEPVIVDAVEPGQVRPTARPGGETLPEPVATPRPAEDAELGIQEELPSQTAAGPATDSETPEVTLPEVAEVAPVIVLGGESQAVELGAELPPSLVLSNWSVNLPFAASELAPNVIGEVGPIAPVWVEEGLMLVGVNGVGVERISDVNDALRSSVEPGSSTSINATFQVLNTDSGQLAEYDWNMPIVQDTLLLNGVQFRTVFADGIWKSMVSKAPENSAGELLVGDVLTTEMTTGLAVTERNSVKAIFEQNIQSGNEKFIFTVDREGTMWVASMNYASGIVQ